MTRLLLIEDNPDEQALIQVYLSDEDYTCDLADSLDGAMALMRQNLYDAILLDLNLPDSVGAATFGALAEYADAIPVVVLTNAPDHEALADTLLVAGAQDFIPKEDVNRTTLLLALRFAMLRHSYKRRDRQRLAAETERRELLETELKEIWYQALSICNKVSRVVEVVAPPDDPPVIQSIREEALAVLKREEAG